MAADPWSDLDTVHVLLVAARSNYEEDHESSGDECLNQAIGLVERMLHA